MQRPESYTGITLGGRYVLGEMLGKGGFGAVYKAVQSDLGRAVAVKILHADSALASDGLARFAREARAAAALGHPNIAQVSDFQIREGEPPFIVLEYLEGQTLGTILRKTPRIEAGRVCAIAHQVLSALDVAHGAGITHRDVKPDNIFLVALPGLDDFVKLLDFGIAKLSSATTALTDFGTMLGTPAFMAPEQISNVLVDHRSDIYSLGATMYYALSGRHAFQAEHMSALLYAIVHQPVTPLATVVPDIDPRLADVVARAMHKSPEGRFASAAEMRAALEPWTLSAPRAGVISPATVQNPPSATVDAGGAPTYPVGHVPSFPPSQMPTASVRGAPMASVPAPTASVRPSAIAPTVDASMRGPSFPPQAMPQYPVTQPPQRSSSGLGILMVVGGGLALVAVLVAAAVVLYVLHGDHDGATASWPWSSPSAAPTVAAASPTGTTPAATAPGGAPAPRGGVAPSPASPGGQPKIADAGVAPAPTTPGVTPPGVTPPGTTPPGAAPAPAGNQRMGARSASFTLGDCTFDLSQCQSAISKVMPGVQACFAATEFDPPNHEVADYSISLNKNGNVTNVSRNRSSGPAHPKLDGCIAGAIRGAKYPTSPSNTRVEVFFRARL